MVPTHPINLAELTLSQRDRQQGKVTSYEDQLKGEGTFVPFSIAPGLMNFCGRGRHARPDGVRKPLPQVLILSHAGLRVHDDDVDWFSADMYYEGDINALLTTWYENYHPPIGIHGRVPEALSRLPDVIIGRPWPITKEPVQCSRSSKVVRRAYDSSALRHRGGRRFTSTFPVHRLCCEEGSEDDCHGVLNRSLPSQEASSEGPATAILSVAISSCDSQVCSSDPSECTSENDPRTSAASELVGGANDSLVVGKLSSRNENTVSLCDFLRATSRITNAGYIPFQKGSY